MRLKCPLETQPLNINRIPTPHPHLFEMGMATTKTLLSRKVESDETG